MLNTDTLKKNYEFKNVLTKGKYYNGNYIDIYIKKNKNISEANFFNIKYDIIKTLNKSNLLKKDED